MSDDDMSVGSAGATDVSDAESAGDVEDAPSPAFVPTALLREALPEPIEGSIQGLAAADVDTIDMLPDSEFVSIHLCPFEGRYILAHSVTGEQRLMPVGPEWQLGDKDGFAFVCDAAGDVLPHGAPSQWASEVLSQSIFARAGGERLVVVDLPDSKSTSVVYLEDVERASRPCVVKWNVGLSQATISYQVFVLEAPRCHSFLLWRLQDIHERARLDVGTAGKAFRSTWVHKRLASWKKGLGDLGIPEAVFSGSPYKNQKPSESPPQSNVVDKPSVTTEVASVCQITFRIKATVHALIRN